MVSQIVLSVLGIAIGFTIWSPGDAAQELGIGAGIWAAVAALISLFLGGVVTGRLAGVLTPGDGALHGGVMWGLGGVAGAATEVVGDDVAAVTMDAIGGDRDALAASIAQRTGMSQAEVRDAIRDAEMRQQQTRIDTAQVRRTAEDVTHYAARGAWWTLLALGLSAAAAAGGAATTAKY
jgi:amino acid transporter